MREDNNYIFILNKVSVSAVLVKWSRLQAQVINVQAVQTTDSVTAYFILSALLG